MIISNFEIRLTITLVVVTPYPKRLNCGTSWWTLRVVLPLAKLGNLP